MAANVYSEHANSWNAWLAWQTEVIDLVQSELRALFHTVHDGDFDWDSWRPYFDTGHTPRDAVQHAFSVQGLQAESRQLAASEAERESIVAMHIEVD